jgi:Cu(I)/Ag(I) efflux system membrane protein CusA/SilA
MALKYRWLMVGLAVLAIAGTIPVLFELGSEFMPPLNEGSILYMPTTLPGISITEATRLLHVQDKIFKQFPEVDTVFGKVGRADTPTDPAPLLMIETTVMLKPEREWRDGMTWKKLIAEMDAEMQFPGVTNAWTMPIKARIDMLTTGIRTPVGIKIYGPDLEVIQDLGQQIEGILQHVKGTRSVYAERVAGGYYVDFIPNREEAARYGLTVEDVEAIVETAIGGKNIDDTIEGRERYKINVRYSRDLREDLEQLGNVLIPTPGGRHVPIDHIADIRISTGPPSIKDENGSLTGWVYVDVFDRDIGGYVKEAQQLLRDSLSLPAEYHLVWAGQYEYMERVAEKLRTVIPLTLLIIFFLLYLNFRSVTEALIVLLSVPFAAIGSIWILYLLGYNTSIAVWVGVIALVGVAAETGVVMLVYLDEVWNRRMAEGSITSTTDVLDAVQEGAVQRVRPKLMAVTTTIAALLPILWGHGVGADVMKRIAAPMVGGLVSSAILTLLIIPAVYAIWKLRQIPKDR